MFIRLLALYNCVAMLLSDEIMGDSYSFAVVVFDTISENFTAINTLFL